MEKIKKIFCIFFVNILVISVMSFSVYAQPTIPKGEIPKNIPSDVRENIEKLYSSNPVDRGYGAYYLGEMGKKAAPAVPFLIEILNDSSSLQWETNYRSVIGNTSPAKEALKALKKIGEPAVEPLIAALKDKDYLVQSDVAEALGEIGDARAVEPLIAAMKGDLLISAALALEKIGNPAVKPLTDALQDKDAKVRWHAAEALEKIGDARAVEPLSAALKDEKEDIRKKAAEALGKIGDAGAVEPLSAALKDESWLVRSCAIDALGTLGDARAVEPLIAALKDEDSSVRISAELALEKITGKNFNDDQTKWQNWWNENKDKIQYHSVSDLTSPGFATGLGHGLTSPLRFFGLFNLHYEKKENWTNSYALGLLIGCLIILSIGVRLFKGKK